MDIKSLSEKHDAYIIDRRRFYHSCPEPSLKEVNTLASIKKDLIEMGITDIVEMKDCYGLYATIHGGKPGKTVALRTDIDALEIVEETGLPFASTNGYMHACGHDNHIATLLGAAKILNDVKDELCGDVRLMVQPAEEVAQGAKGMVKEGAMDGVDAIYGTHVWGDFDAPYFDFVAGNRMACCHIFKIEVTGTSAHGSAPNLGKDAITCAAAMVNNIQQIVSRINNPLNPLVITIGKIDGGTRFNVIPNKVVMEGTVRTFSTGTEVEDEMRHIVEKTAETFKQKAVLTYDYLTMPVINDEKLANIARGAVTKLFGEGMLLDHSALMGSEDFSWFGEKAPYVFGFVGTRNEKEGKIYSNHQEKYDVDESALHKSAAVMAQFAADFLNE